MGEEFAVSGQIVSTNVTEDTVNILETVKGLLTDIDKKPMSTEQTAEFGDLLSEIKEMAFSVKQQIDQGVVV